MNKILRILNEDLKTKGHYYVTIIESDPTTLALFAIEIDNCLVTEDYAVITFQLDEEYELFKRSYYNRIEVSYLEIDFENNRVIVMNPYSDHSNDGMRSLSKYLGRSHTDDPVIYKAGPRQNTDRNVWEEYVDPYRSIVVVTHLWRHAFRIYEDTVTELRTKSIEFYESDKGNPSL